MVNSRRTWHLGASFTAVRDENLASNMDAIGIIDGLSCWGFVVVALIWYLVLVYRRRTTPRERPGPMRLPSVPSMHAPRPTTRCESVTDQPCANGAEMPVMRRGTPPSGGARRRERPRV